MKFNPLQHPVIFTNPLRLTVSSWIQHLPFGMFLVDILKPKILVELGTHYGVSYCGFCQAVKELRTDTWCYAVDNWGGDEHTGAYGEEVYEDLKSHHDPRYGDFSKLLRMNFDEALPYFADGSIDLLHIDGYHSYEAVKHDFETWLPKLSDRAVVIFHDINEREREFGVWRFWDEVKTGYPSFELLHEHGLGVLAVGAVTRPPELDDLLQATQEDRTQLREFFFFLGLRITALTQYAEFADRLRHVQNLQATLAARDAEIGSAKEYIASLLALQSAQSAALENTDAIANQLHAESESTSLEIAAAREAEIQTQLESFHAIIEQNQSVYDAKVESLRAIIEQNQGLADANSASLTAALGQAQSNAARLQDRINSLQKEIVKAHEVQQSTSAFAESLVDARAEKERELRELQQLYAAVHHELAVVRGSFVHRRVATPLWKLRQRILPDGSGRSAAYFRLRNRGRTTQVTPAVAMAAAIPAVVVTQPPPPAPQVNIVLSPLEIPAGSTVICTIISKNYLAAARTLMRSIHRFHPEIHLVTLLVDEIEGCFNPQDEVFATYLASDLDIPNWRHFSMKYDIMELNTAVKPYLLDMLFERHNAQKVIYFDPDIVVYHDLNPLLELLDQHMAVLTPHILDPIQDTLKPSEVDFLQVGTFNLGFFAISRQGQWRDLLTWWKDKLYAFCTREVERGLFVDQHWMDLVPSLFEKVYILRDAGYNVAYWNIQRRQLSRDSHGNYVVNERPLIFFHYSGFSVDNVRAVSKHQNRYTLDQLNEHYQASFEGYRTLLLDNGHMETKTWGYAYGRFADGVPVSDVLRMCLRGYDLVAEIWTNPYDVSAADSFRNWAVHPQALPSTKYLSPYALTYYSIRADLHKTFPEPLGADERRFAQWFVEQAGRADVFHPFYVDPIRAALSDGTHVLPPAPKAQKKKALTNRVRQTIRYYNGYPVHVKPHLPPQAITIRSESYTGPTNIYGGTRQLLNRIGILQAIRRLVGLRVILSLRFFFSDSHSDQPVSSFGLKTSEFKLPPMSLVETEQPALTAGANVIGYLRSETGVAEAARKVLRSLDAVKFPVAAYPIDVHDTSRKQDATIDSFQQGLPHKVNIFHVNADMTAETRRLLGQKTYEGRYNIGYWFWEMPRFPAQWHAHADVYDEIWVGSRFVQQAIAEQVQTPVIHMPGSIEVKLPAESTRLALGLPDDTFVVLFVFDALSIIERKNPWAVIQAFEQAFSAAERANKVKLVMKITNLERFPFERNRLYAAMQNVNGVILDKYLTRLEVNALIDHCDAYISLHRSEGFGLTLAEAMYLGKPCIATAYSGNMDFMNTQNSYLVPYQLLELDTAYPPYDAGNHWANPDVGAAAHFLREIYTRRDEASQKGLRASAYLREHYAPEAAGKRIAAHLQTILDHMTASAF